MRRVDLKLFDVVVVDGELCIHGPARFGLMASVDWWSWKLGFTFWPYGRTLYLQLLPLTIEFFREPVFCKGCGAPVDACCCREEDE